MSSKKNNLIFSSDKALGGKKVQIDKITKSQGKCTKHGRNFTCKLGHVPPGRIPMVEVIVKAKGEKVKNTVNVSSTTNDPDLSNNFVETEPVTFEKSRD